MSYLPAGTVTFLFTDIEGSTRKWQNWPHRMKRALKQHDDILNKAIEDNGGHVFKTVGDAFCAAFHTAMDCINCAVDAQVQINSHSWDLPERIRVRMSIHTGEAVERNNDYYGPALNRVARLEALAYGGQVLMSLVTAELIRDMLPLPAGLKYIGKHRLKDLTRPEDVYQLTHPELPSDFPPVKSLDYHPNNLPVLPGILLGRRKELETIMEKLLNPRFRTVSVTGTGGMGKTRIALQTAAELIENFNNGVFFIDLTKITDPSGLYSLILTELSVRESESRRPFEQLREYLADKDILLILDNFEHILPAAVSAAKLLSECAGLKYLVTSREALHIRGESVYRLPPLEIPVLDRKKSISIKKLTQYDSVNLFIERAEDIDENFRINKKNAAAVAEICMRLDGIPLAIELAAARISALSPNAILRRLNRRLELLTFGAADLPDRQQTLLSTIEWSYNLLSGRMQKFFISLSVFKVGFDMEAAKAVTSGITGISVLDGVGHLLEKSLLIKKETEDNEPVFIMLETINEYASYKLNMAPFSIRVFERYAEYFSAMAANGERGIQSPDQKKWMDKLSLNHENLDSAIDWYFAGGLLDKSAATAAALRPYWEIKGCYSAGVERYRKLLDAGHVKEDILDRVKTGLGAMCIASGDYDCAVKVLEQVLNKPESEERIKVLVHYYLGWGYFRNNELQKAEEHFNTSFNLADKTELRTIGSKSYAGKGLVCWKKGSLKEAEKYLSQALEMLSGFSDPRSIAQTANNLGIILYRQRNYKEAEKYFAMSFELSKTIGDVNETRKLLSNLGYLNYRMKRYSPAVKYYRKLAGISAYEKLFLGTAYSGLSMVNLELDQLDSALKNSEKAVAVLDSPGTRADHAIALRVLGDVRRRREEFLLARNCYNRAIPVLKKYMEDEELELALKGLADSGGE